MEEDHRRAFRRFLDNRTNLRKSYEKQYDLLQETVAINQRLQQYSQVLHTLQEYRIMDNKQKEIMENEILTLQKNEFVQKKIIHSLQQRDHDQNDQLTEYKEQIDTLTRINKDKDKRLIELTENHFQTITPAGPVFSDRKQGEQMNSNSSTSLQRYINRSKIAFDYDYPTPFQEWIKENYPNAVHRPQSSSSLCNTITENNEPREEISYDFGHHQRNNNNNSLHNQSSNRTTNKKEPNQRTTTVTTPSSNSSSTSHPFAKGAEEYRQQWRKNNSYLTNEKIGTESSSSYSSFFSPKNNCSPSTPSLTYVINETNVNLSKQVKDQYQLLHRT